MSYMRTAAVSAFLMLILLEASAAEEYVTFRATPGLSNEAIEYIAKKSELRTGIVRRGEAAEAFIAQVCGTVTNTFAKVFFKLNPTAQKLDVTKDRRVLLPACAKWRRDSASGDGLSVIVSASDTLDTLLRRYIGRSGSQIYLCAADTADNAPSSRCNLTFREIVQNLNKGIDLANLSPGRELKLPFFTAKAWFKARSDDPQSIDDHIARIKEMTGYPQPDSPLISIEKETPAWLVEPVSTELNDAETSCSQASTLARAKGIPWPYDAATVTAAIRRTISQLTSSYTAILTIIDTGVDETFPKTLLYNNGDAKAPYGIGVYRRTNIAPYRDQQPDDVKFHGSRVARIATGFPALQQAFPSLSSYIKINVVNVMEHKGEADYFIAPHSLEIASSWFSDNGDIANVSVRSKDHLNGVREIIKSNRALLVVAAAGNDIAKLDQINDDWYPASYGGSNPSGGVQFVTVAALDSNLARAYFSNHSEKYADLFAPGCDVPYDQQSSGVTGTSFAAPLVSMTAALLKSFGLRTPKEIKDRLHASVDYDEAYKALVLWSGRLNIPKALSIYDDVLELGGQSLEFGRWALPDQICSDIPIPPDTVRKISLLQSNPLQIHVVWSDSQSVLGESDCTPAGDGFSLQGRADPVPWSDLVDFVRRSKFQ